MMVVFCCSLYVCEILGVFCACVCSVRFRIQSFGGYCVVFIESLGVEFR